MSGGEPPRQGKPRVASASRGALAIWFVLLALFAWWELAARQQWVDPELLPPPSKIGQVILTLIADRRFTDDLMVTALECAVAFLVVVPAGLLTGFVLAESPRLEAATAGLLQTLMTVPKSIFLPAFILLLGIGFAEKVVFAVALSYFLVVPTGIAAVRSVPRGLVTAARAYGASRGQIYRLVYLPYATPIVLDGVRIGLIFSMHGILFAEMYASTEGIGRSILEWGESFNLPTLFAAVALVVLATIVINGACLWAEARARARVGITADRMR
jgi:NitT/TauT family transport system permease protein